MNYTEETSSPRHQVEYDLPGFHTKTSMRKFLDQINGALNRVEEERKKLLTWKKEAEELIPTLPEINRLGNETL